MKFVAWAGLCLITFMAMMHLLSINSKLRGTVTGNILTICKRNSTGEKWVPNKVTSRHLADFEDMVPAFIDWQKLLNSVSNGSVLEIGTGAGRALLDLKALYPFANAFGTNHYRDGYSQIEGSIESMWNV